MSASRPSPAAEAKRKIGEFAAGLIESGMRVGLGTGSTAAEMVNALGRRWREEGLRFQAVGTSSATEELARQFDIPVLALDPSETLDIYLDGADEIDGDGNLIKGLGGALLREKLVAANAKRHVIMVDSSKPVRRLGTKGPLPVEVVKFGADTTRARIEALGCTPSLRMRNNGPFLTDEGHLTFDCTFSSGIADPVATGRALKDLLGVVETGLFCGYCDEVLIGSSERVELIGLLDWNRRIAEFLAP